MYVRKYGRSQWTFITGDSGCGKTSLLKNITYSLLEDDYYLMNLIKEGRTKIDLDLSEKVDVYAYGADNRLTNDESNPYRLGNDHVSEDNVYSIFRPITSYRNINRYLKLRIAKELDDINSLENITNIISKINNIFPLEVDIYGDKKIEYKTTSQKALEVLIGDLLTKIELDLEKKAIVIIDDFDMFMSRNDLELIIEKLCKLLPNVQFIVSIRNNLSMYYQILNLNEILHK